MAEIPYSFNKTNNIIEIRQRYEDVVSPGEHLKDCVSIAGRAMLIRRQGGLCFVTLKDQTGQIQLMAQRDKTPHFDKFIDLSFGDWIGVEGNIVKTKRGELSVSVKEWHLLAKAVDNFGDKYHKINDVDFRYRHREADLWVNDEVRQIFLKRSKIIKLIRSYLDSLGFIEVETPVLNPVLGGANARPFVTYHRALDSQFYLRIAPELYLKRLVVGGFEKVFEIARVFRNEGISPRHNPEFTLLELYVAYKDYMYLMDLVESLILHLATEVNGIPEIINEDKKISLNLPWRRVEFLKAVSQKVDYPVDINMSVEKARELCSKFSCDYELSWGVGKLLLELFEKIVEPTLIEPTIIYDYPLEVSPLARPHRNNKLLVERFEVFIAGKEVVNAFSELNDPTDQQQRFAEQLARKNAGDEEAMEIDYDYIKALRWGLPPTAGAGIGIDRLVMLLTGVSNIKDVILFPTLKPIKVDQGND
jgi:lysyl-tRNA synthetase class 2